MKWRKLGKIFDPREHKLANGCVEYAQSPQALVRDDRVRVYFSTRSVDRDGGKPRSHVSYVDMARSLDRILGVAEHTVIEQGGLGCFDEHGIFPMSPLQVGDVVLGYTCGWSRRVSVSVETAIGLVVSEDAGRTFRRVGDGPILTASLREPFLVGDGFVRLLNGCFHMWYIFGTGWRRYSPDGDPERTYKIGHAVSDNGVSWVKEEGRQVVSDRLGVEESQALPTVIEINGRYHMFFCYRHSRDFRRNADRAYRIGHAVSDDLLNWARDDQHPAIDVSVGGWDSEMLCYPNVFECDREVWLLYNGNQFGRFGFGLAVLE